MTLHGKAREQVEAFEAMQRSGIAANRGAEQQRAENAEERANTGMIVPIEVGCIVHTDPTKLRGADDEISQQSGAMSGVVLSVRDVDGGDMVRVANLFGRSRRFARWEVAQLDCYRTEPPDPHALSRAVRMLWRAVSTEGLLSADDARVIGDIQRLTARIMAKGHL